MLIAAPPGYMWARLDGAPTAHLVDAHHPTTSYCNRPRVGHYGPRWLPVNRGPQCRICVSYLARLADDRAPAAEE